MRNALRRGRPVGYRGRVDIGAERWTKPYGSSPVPRIRGMWVMLLGLLVSLTAASAADTAPPVAGRSPSPGALAPVAAGLSVLTNAQQLIDLGMEGARLNPHPVRLRGVITHVARSFNNWIYVQDGTAGILVVYQSIDQTPAIGVLVEVEGTAGVGAFHTFVRNARVRAVGEARLPVPRQTPPERLAAGADFGHWVRVRATVRNMASAKGHIMIQATARDLTFFAWVENPGRQPLPAEWLDAEVEIDGLAWTVTDALERPVGFRIFPANLSGIRVVRPALPDLFQTPLAEARELRKLTQPRETPARVHGVVTYATPAGDGIILNDGTGPVSVNRLLKFDSDLWAAQTVAGDTNAVVAKKFPSAVPKPGDVLEVVGTPLGESPYCARLYGAEYRIVGQDNVPSPRAITGGDGLNPKNDCELVRLKARFVDRTSGVSGTNVAQQLWLQSDDLIFEARLLASPGETLAVPDGSLVEVTGICTPVLGEMRKPRGIRILLRSTSDVKVVTASTPLFNRATWKVLAGGGGLLGVALGWVALLRRQVRERTEALATTNHRLQSEVEERRRAQADLHRALAVERELSELKSRFVSLVSHEFRTPLGITMSAVELLRHYLDRLTPARRQELLDDIYSSTLRMSGLMEQVLLLGRVEAGKVAFNPAPLDLEALAGRLVDESHSATNRRCPILLETDGEFTGARADESLLRHVFSNLLSNAVKYSPAGSDVRFRVRRENREAVFEVSDKGIGIPEADRPRLFEAFHRASNVGEISGTGLGLLLVQRCVQLHQGRIDFESKVGLGTTFTVRLPLFPS